MQEQLKRTPLFEEHKRLGARIVPFAGWEMPVVYTKVTEEHTAVREAAGLFDVSHMGELRLRGEKAAEVVDRLVTNDVGSLEPGRALYTCACNERGTILDDLIIYRIAEDDVLIVCNASNLGKMAPHFERHAEIWGEGECSFEDQSEATSLLALQGPKAQAIAEAAGMDAELLALPSFHLREGSLAGKKILAARTGYTGEDGFEIFCANEDAVAIFGALEEAGKEHGLVPAGLGARDTLRLESRLSLYGNEIDETTNPFEAGLGWVVKLKTERDFLGKQALIAIREERRSGAPMRKLVGIEMVGRGIARHGYPILAAEGEDEIGVVTSGSPGPTVGKNIGLGYVPSALSKIGTPLRIQVRKKLIEAVVVKTPFYKRSR